MPSKSPEEKTEFVMGFVGFSDNFRAQYVDRWIETLNNFTVGSSASPGQFQGSRPASVSLDRIFLKDPETHKAIMTYAAKLVRGVFGDSRGEYIQAEPVGWEDAVGAAPTVSRLLRYAFGLPGHFRTMLEAVMDMLLFGTSIVEVGWRYEEREMPVRSVSNEFGVDVMGTPERRKIPVYDDVDLSVVDIQDFYPDPGEYRIERMKGCAKRFKRTLNESLALAEKGIYIKSALDGLGTVSPSSGNRTWDKFREGVDQPNEIRRMGQFNELIGYEYWGEVPWIEDDGTSRRVLTVLDGVLVRDDPWPLSDPELPFKTMVINPVCGRFYGISPAEVIRYDQDFADVLKELIARAIIRQVHPPIAFDPDSELDVAMIRRWRTDMPIPVRGGPASVGTVRYDANVGAASQILAFTKNSMQEASGAQGGIQGEPGPDREAATAASLRVNSAMDRPELAAMMLERESLPAIGRAILRRYQQFLEGQEDLSRRIGELPAGVWIGDILSEYDIRFVGSRMSQSRAMKLQSLQTLAQLSSAIPVFQAQIPWQDLAKAMVGDILELPEVAAKMPDPKQVMANVLMSQMMGPGAGNNQMPSSAQPPGLPEGQAQGGELGGA